MISLFKSDPVKLATRTRSSHLCKLVILNYYLKKKQCASIVATHREAANWLASLVLL